MNNSIAVITTFPNASWEIYSKKMLQSFTRFWPAEIPLLLELDDDLLVSDVQKILRQQDAVAVGWDKEHQEFVERNKGKDDPNDYRKQPVRFCHKIFAIKRALKAIESAKANNENPARYLIWMDADVVTNRSVTIDEIKECLPKEGEAVAYMGRKDWDHSECGWMAFDLENGGAGIIEMMISGYITDEILGYEQLHDSWVFDMVCGITKVKCTNLTYGKPGMDIWPHSPMGKWSTHYKGPVAKSALEEPTRVNQGNYGQQVIIQTRNAIPNEKICQHIERNQQLISEWIRPCKENTEKLIVVSAGPTLIAEDLLKEYEEGYKIIAVKHALIPLKEAGIKPWACILLDPRPHVADFVKNADPDILWFVATQVDPAVTLELLARGCRIIGYHASVNANEETLTSKQAYSIISGGSATATRGLYMLNHLGFKRFKLYGYDLCLPDKPDLNARDDQGQPKYLEFSVGMNDPLYNVKRCFWAEPQLIAQFEEISDIIKRNVFEIEAIGYGAVPFIINAQRVANLRRSKIRSKMIGDILPSYHEVIKCSRQWNSHRKTSFLTKWLGRLPLIHHKPTLAMKSL